MMAHERVGRAAASRVARGNIRLRKGQEMMEGRVARWGQGMMRLRSVETGRSENYIPLHFHLRNGVVNT